MSEATPSMEAQRRFWDGWNHDYREHGLDDFMRRQRDEVVEFLRLERSSPLRILEVGCGNGWLCNELKDFGDVTGIDLSPRSIAAARERFPQLHFLEGNFAELSGERPFDLVLSVDVIAHVADQETFIRHCAELVRPGGSFLLMTQNPFVWNRSSYLMPRGEGQIRDWPDSRRLRRWMAPHFEIQRVRSIVPGGDRGILRALNHPAVLRGLRSFLGWRRSTALYERAGVGRELVFLATRRAPVDPSARD